VLQLQRHYRRFGVPAAELMILLQQNNHAELSALLQRLPWWQKLQQSRQVPVQIPKQLGDAVAAGDKRS